MTKQDLVLRSDRIETSTMFKAVHILIFLSSLSSTATGTQSEGFRPMRGKCQVLNVTSFKLIETSEDRRQDVQHWNIYVYDLLQAALKLQNSKLDH